MSFLITKKSDGYYIYNLSEALEIFVSESKISLWYGHGEEPIDIKPSTKLKKEQVVKLAQYLGRLAAIENAHEDLDNVVEQISKV